MKLREQEIRIATIHATAWERAFNIAKENSERRNDVDKMALRTLSTFALILGGEYRRIANAEMTDE